MWDHSFKTKLTGTASRVKEELGKLSHMEVKVYLVVSKQDLKMEVVVKLECTKRWLST